jgi:hypothetical protein
MKNDKPKQGQQSSSPVIYLPNQDHYYTSLVDIIETCWKLLSEQYELRSTLIGKWV